MNASPATLAMQVRTARRVNRVSPNPLVYSTRSGQTSFAHRAAAAAPVVCADVRKYGSHVLTDVTADLPGDRSVGYCSCGEYMDTGTFNEREGIA